MSLQDYLKGQPVCTSIHPILAQRANVFVAGGASPRNSTYPIYTPRSGAVYPG